VIDIDKIPLNFGEIAQRWERMDENTIIKDSLINGNITLALSFLYWRKDKGSLLL
jgi:hypothetical protein